jgi:hypothetical protein
MELILQIQLFREMDHHHHYPCSTTSFSNNHNIIINRVKIILHIPRLYPHVPPTIDCIDYYYHDDDHHHHHYDNTAHDSNHDNDYHHQQQPQQQKHDRWIAGNYYKAPKPSLSPSVLSLSPYEKAAMCDSTLLPPPLPYHSDNCQSTHDNSNHYSNNHTNYRFKHDAPLQDIIILSSPGDNEDYDNPTSSSSSTTCRNHILYIEKWTPIHRISDVIDWIVDGIVEPIPTTGDNIAANDDTTTTVNVVTKDNRNNYNASMSFDEEKDEYGGKYDSIHHALTKSQRSPTLRPTTNETTCGDGKSEMLSSNYIIQRQNSLPSSTTKDEYRYDNSHEQMNIVTESSSSSAVAAVDTNTTSTFLHPNRFHVGYQHDDDHHNITTNTTTKNRASLSLSNSRPIPMVNGYWNNRSMTTDIRPKNVSSEPDTMVFHSNSNDNNNNNSHSKSIPFLEKIPPQPSSLWHHRTNTATIMDRMMKHTVPHHVNHTSIHGTDDDNNDDDEMDISFH